MSRKVKCYRLADVLMPEQMATVRPFMRETFTGTWDATYGDRYRGPGVRDLMRRWTGRYYVADVERVLYLRARMAGCAHVMHAGRRR